MIQMVFLQVGAPTSNKTSPHKKTLFIVFTKEVLIVLKNCHEGMQSMAKIPISLGLALVTIQALRVSD